MYTQTVPHFNLNTTVMYTRTVPHLNLNTTVIYVSVVVNVLMYKCIHEQYIVFERHICLGCV